MKHVRFFLDHEGPASKRKGEHQGNVTAVIVGNGINYTLNDMGQTPCYDAIGAVYYCPNSPVASTSVSLEWMHTCGRRISEKEAREIHPELFLYLDYDPEQEAS
jgi:hypothetical protein